MSKYELLWKYLKENNKESYKLSYEEIKNILGFLKVQSFKENPKACVYFCDKRFYRGIMIKGTVEVLEDKESKEMVWQFGDTMYYKKGVTDPDYCVLKFTSISARYYSNFKSEDIEI